MRIAISVHDPPVWTIPTRELERLRLALPEDEVMDARSREDRRRAWPEADVLVATRIKAEEFALARRVKWIHSTAVGVLSLLPQPVVESDVIVTNTRGVLAEPLAEHAIALMLGARRRFPVASAGQAERRWRQEELLPVDDPPLSRSCLLVVGLGAIGSRVASHGAGLGMHVIGIRRRPDRPPPPGVAEVAPPDRLREWLGRADAVILAAPQVEEDRALIGDAEFEAMRPHAVLVNVARGGLVDERALERALERGRIAGAGLDAFVEEPLPPDSPLWRLPNLLITPHSASFGTGYWNPVLRFFLENVERFRRGVPLENVVDKVNRY